MTEVGPREQTVSARRTPFSAAGWVRAWLPNGISLLRVALVPLGLLANGACAEAAAADRAVDVPRAWALLLLCTIGASDLVDGYVARRWGLVTATGALLDALADKLVQISYTLFFALNDSPAFPRLPLWFFLLLAGRDALLAVGWALLRHRRGAPPAHRAHGKAASALIFGLLLWITAGWPQAGVDLAVWAVTLIVAGSTAAYLREGWRRLRVG